MAMLQMKQRSKSTAEPRRAAAVSQQLTEHALRWGYAVFACEQRGVRDASNVYLRELTVPLADHVLKARSSPCP